MKKLILLMIFASVIISCSEDNAPNESSSNPLVGIWEATDPSGGGEILRVTFKSDGEFIFEKYESDTEVDSAKGVFQLNDKLVTINTDWGNGVYSWNVSGSNLTLTLSSSQSDDLSYYLTLVVWKKK